MVLFPGAFFSYSDGIGTIVKMATAYGCQIGPGTEALNGALGVVQIVGRPFTFAFGARADRVGTRDGIMLAFAVYSGISVSGCSFAAAWHSRVQARTRDTARRLASAPPRRL